MNWTQVKIDTTTEGIDIISGLLIYNGINGVMIDDSEDFKEFIKEKSPHWDYIDEDLVSIKSISNSITFYIPNNIQGIEQLKNIKQLLSSVREFNKGINLGSLNITTDMIDEEDWSTAWKKYYFPIKISKRIVVVPEWESYQTKENETMLLLDPGMAFGTGTHETTRLCVNLLEDVIEETSSILDVGTGSGILSIASILLGAKSAVGIDIDELAVKIANENAILNGVGDKIQVFKGDLTEQITGKFDIVCANIVADVIIRLSDYIYNFMNKSGVLIVSGIIKEREQDVLNSLLKNGFNLKHTIYENDWLAMQLTR